MSIISSVATRKVFNLETFSWIGVTKVSFKDLLVYALSSVRCAMCVSGVILRDSHGVAQVRFVTGNKILRILKSKGLAPDLPEDLYHLIKKAVAVRKHLERNRKVSAPLIR